MISTSGSELLPQAAVTQLSTHLLPLATVLTPNIPEANLILSQNGKPIVDITSADDLETIAHRIRELGPQWVLVKGGHVPFKEDLTTATEPQDRKVVVDVLAGPDGVVRFPSSWQDSSSTHGTGCSLACKSYRPYLRPRYRSTVLITDAERDQPPSHRASQRVSTFPPLCAQRAASSRSGSELL